MINLRFPNELFVLYMMFQFHLERHKKILCINLINIYQSASLSVSDMRRFIVLFLIHVVLK